MERHPSPANLNALRSIGWDPAYDEETRKTALHTVSVNLAPEDRFRLFVDMYRELPELYSQNVDFEWRQLLRPAGNEPYLLRMLAEIRRQPDRHAAAQLLGLMAAHVRAQAREGRPAPPWTRELEQTFDQLLALTDDRLPWSVRASVQVSRREVQAAQQQRQR